MSTNWTPSAGMRRAHDLVEKIGFEASAAESLITPLFKHRLVELIAGEIDEAVHLALSEVLDRAEAAGGSVHDDPDFSELEADPTGGVTIASADVSALTFTGARGVADSGVRGTPGSTPQSNGHAKPTAQAEPPAEKPKAAASSKKAKKKGKKGTLQLSGAAKRIADKRLREAAAQQAMENLPVPIDGMERM